MNARARQVDAALEIIPVPGIEACLTQTNSRQLVKVGKAEQEAQPKPHSLKRSRASFLQDFVDPLPSSPAPKRYRPESVDILVTQWVESALGSEPYRQRHCRSDTLLSYSHGDIIPRRLTKSAPNMEYRRDADGFALPPTTASTRSHSYQVDVEDDPLVSSYAQSVTSSVISSSSTSSSRKQSLLEHPSYRDMNLAENNIYIRSSREQFPDNTANLVDHVRKDRDYPGPSPDQVWQDMGLATAALA